MQLHTVRPSHRPRRGRRVGRGGKRGTYSGRGIKGQKARAGAKIRPAIRDFIKSVPKLRGQEFPKLPQQPKPTVVNIGDLRRHFAEGATVSPKTLAAAGLLPSPTTPVKLLGSGDPPPKLLVRGVAVSKTAREKITRAGGSVS